MRWHLRAGFELVGVTATRGFIALQLSPERMPDALPALGTQTVLA